MFLICAWLFVVLVTGFLAGARLGAGNLHIGRATVFWLPPTEPMKWGRVTPKVGWWRFGQLEIWWDSRSQAERDVPPKIEPAKVTNAYGLYVDMLQPTNEVIEQMPKEAEHLAEVHINMDGEQREFTFADFKQRLGFAVSR